MERGRNDHRASSRRYGKLEDANELFRNVQSDFERIRLQKLKFISIRAALNPVQIIGLKIQRLPNLTKG